MKKKGLLFCIIIVFVCINSLAIAHQDDGKIAAAAATITKQELRHHIFFLASDALQGRFTGSEGYKIAANYAIAQFKAAGLKPIVTDSDGNKTFLQPFSLDRSAYSPQSSLSIVSTDGEKTFYLGDKFALALPGNAANPDYS